MKTIKYFLLILAIAGMGLLLQNCGKHKCDNDTVTDYSISSKDRSKVPYTGFETLTFVRTTIGDTHTFIANGWKDDWGLTSTTDDCPQKERYERQQLIFTSPTFSKAIVLSMYRQTTNKFTYLDISFQNTSFYTTSAYLSAPYRLDSLNIMGLVYHDIVILSDIDLTTPETYQCYYNSTNGILKLFFGNGETWELLKTT